MSTFGDDLIQSLREALAHAKGDGPAIVHPAVPPQIRELTKTQMAPGGHEPLATGGGSRAQTRQGSAYDDAPDG